MDGRTQVLLYVPKQNPKRQMMTFKTDSQWKVRLEQLEQTLDGGQI